MSNIAERLCKPRIMMHAAKIGADVTLTEAANEIKRLQAALRECVLGRKDWMEKARAALERK